MIKGVLSDARSDRLRYGAAVLLVCAALLASILLRPALESNSLPLFIAATLVSAWFGGRGPGLLATILSVLILSLILLDRDELGTWERIAVTGGFLVAAILASDLAGSRRAAHPALKVQISHRRQSVGSAEERITLSSSFEPRTAVPHTERLFDLAADLSKALSTSEIIDIVLAQGVPAIGANGGGVSLLTDDGESFQIAGTAGMPEPLVERWRRYPRVGQFPLSTVAATNEPVWIESPEDWRAKFPDTFPDFLASGHRSMASLPLIFEGRLLGGISFDFSQERIFEDEEKTFMRAVAHQTALALERARLFELEQVARRTAASAEARYRGLFESSVDAVFVLDPLGVIVDANSAALSLLGLSADAVTGRPFVGFWGDELADSAHDRRLTGELGVWEVEHELVCADGSRVPVETRAVAVNTPTDGLILASSREITRRRQIERAQQALFASVSHDLKSPLAAISLQTQLMMRQLHKQPDQQSQALAARLDVVLASTQRMGSIIDELVEVARLRLGHPLRLNYSQCDLVEIARQSVARHREGAPGHQIALVVAQEFVIGFWDAGRLERVFDNLLSNAVKFSPNGGEIFVEITCDSDEREAPWATVAVRDDGIGIPAGDLPHIFEHFRRGANAQDRMVGSGIGLAGVRQIVEQHGGVVSAESIEGSGSIVRLRLPLGDIDLMKGSGRQFESIERSRTILA